MPFTATMQTRARVSVAAIVLLLGGMAALAGAQQPESKSPIEKASKAENSSVSKQQKVIKLPDGTYLWLGSSDSKPGVTLTPDQLRKLVDQTEQLKNQLAARKAIPPSICAASGTVSKRGEQLVAVLRFKFAFRTSVPQTAVALGGRRGFLVAAVLDGDNRPVLETTEDGFSLLAEKPGDHSLTLDLEAPITSRGAKPELGFEIGMPRAPITTLLFAPPGAEVKRLNLITRTTDPGKRGLPEPRRIAGLEVSQLSSRPGHELGYPLGPIDSLEVTWDPPVTSAQPSDHIRSAEVNLSIQLTESVVETTAKLKPHGDAQVWSFVIPSSADVSVDRAPGAAADTGAVLPPVVKKPSDPRRPVWSVEMPAGSTASDWVVTAVTRQLRPKPDEAKHRGPYAIGPFAVLDVLRQTGTVRVAAAPNTRFAFRHGPDLRKAEPSEPISDETSSAFFKLLTGPTGTNAVNIPLFTLEAWAQAGDVAVKPTFRLTLTEAGWRVRAEVKVIPIRTAIDDVLVEVPAEWRGLELSPPELVEEVKQSAGSEGFWEATSARLAGSLRVPVTVRLAGVHKQPFDLVLTGTVPFEPGATVATIQLPRFPGAFEKEASVAATVPEGMEVRGELRGSESEFALWGPPLTPVPDADGKLPRIASSISARSETGLSRVLLAWNPHNPDLVAQVQSDLTLGERQIDVTQKMTLHSGEGLPRQLRFRAPVGAANIKSQPPLLASGGDWILPIPFDTKEVVLTVSFAVPLPPRPTDGDAAWQVPVRLMSPVGTKRAETTVRVWSNSVASRILSPSTPGWRELVAEANPERDSLPALSLAATGTDVPLTLTVREIHNPAAVTVWIDRGLVQAWSVGDASTEYLARFMVRRWLAPSMEFRIPGTFAAPNPEFRIDGLKVNGIPVPDSNGDRAYRIPLPAPGKPVAIEVRYQLPATSGRVGKVVYQPPLLNNAMITGRLRWQVTLPSGATPLLSGGGNSEFHWQFGMTGLAPAPIATPEELERWFQTGDEPSGAGSDTRGMLTVRQAGLESLSIYRIPRTWLISICSAFAFVLMLMLSRLPGWAVGPAIGILGCGLGVAAILLPHVAASAVGACQPGLAGALLVFATLALARLVYRRRVSRLPGFSRHVPEPAVEALPLPSSARKRPSVVGSSGAIPPSQVGG